MKLTTLLAAALVSLLVLAGVSTAANAPTVKTESKRVPPPTQQGSLGKATADPRCPDRRFALAGGFVGQAEPGNVTRRANVFSSVPSGRRWRGVGASSAPEGGRITVSAYCSKRKPNSVRSRSVSIPSGQTRALRVRCPRGKQVVGVGYEGEFAVRLREGVPSGRATIVYAARRGSAREALIKGASQSFGPVQAGRLTGYAVCSKSQRLREVSDTVRVGPGTDGNAVAKCPRGSTAQYGGFEQILPGGSPSGVQGGVVDSVRSGERTWRVRLTNEASSGAPSLKVRSYAYCAG